MKSGIPQKHLSLNNKSSWEVSRKRLSLQLQNKYFLTETAADWGVDTWAIALGIVDKDKLNKITKKTKDAIKDIPNKITAVAQTPIIEKDDVFKTDWPIRVFTRERGQNNWRFLGETPGEFVVLAGHEIGLRVSKLKSDNELEILTKEIEYDNRITGIDLTDCDWVSEVGLAYLSKLNQVTYLILYGCDQIRDAWLAHVSKLSQLTWLNLHYCSMISDAGLLHLGKLRQLTKLRLRGCEKVTNVGVENLKKKLHDLDISR
ncbi:MAG: hypothetical protein FVQ83_06095 [Chloroflexi bacterium]|nr:hypothetical protein [Chloroflexota bacterium]